MRFRFFAALGVAFALLASPATGSPSNLKVSIDAVRWGAVFVELNASPGCSGVGDTKITFSSRGQSTVNRTDQNVGRCDHVPNYDRAYGPDWEQKGVYGMSRFRPDPDMKPGIYRFRFYVRTNNKLMVGGHFLVQVKRVRPSERINEGSDAFVNYCINEGREIRSSDGRLYCVRPAKDKTKIRQLVVNRKVGTP